MNSIFYAVVLVLLAGCANFSRQVRAPNSNPLLASDYPGKCELEAARLSCEQEERSFGLVEACKPASTSIQKGWSMQVGNHTHEVTFNLAKCLVYSVKTVGAPPFFNGAELYTEDTIKYGRMDVRMKVAKADGVISSFFLWKKDSDIEKSYWNEIDIEIPGNNTSGFYTYLHSGRNEQFGLKHEEAFLNTSTDLSADFHIYSIEWTPDYIAWYLDGKLLKKSEGEQVKDFRNVSMQYRFNIWPTARDFWAGKFTAKELPVEHTLDWVQYSEYRPESPKNFRLKWRDDFSGKALNAKWLRGDWNSPSDISKHEPGNIVVSGGHVILKLSKR